jgi:hypothetical protein
LALAEQVGQTLRVQRTIGAEAAQCPPHDLRAGVVENLAEEIVTTAWYGQGDRAGLSASAEGIQAPDEPKLNSSPRRRKRAGQRATAYARLFAR